MPQSGSLPEEKPTHQPTDTPTKIVTPFPLQPDVTPNYIGTSIARSNEVIGRENLKRFARVAQWGRGTISGVRFTPDGAAFVAGSALGLTSYDMNDLQAPPGLEAIS